MSIKTICKHLLFPKYKTNQQGKQYHTAYKPGQGIRLVDIVYDLKRVYEIINGNKIEPAFKLIPENKLCKKRKHNDKHHYKKGDISNDAIGYAFIPALGQY